MRAFIRIMISFPNALSTIYEDVLTKSAHTLTHSHDHSTQKQYKIMKNDRWKEVVDNFCCCYVSADVVNPIDVHNSMKWNNEYFTLHFLKLLISKFCTTTMPMIITQNCHCQKQPNLFSYTAVCSVKWLMIFDWLHSHHDVNIRIYAQFNAHKKEFPGDIFQLTNICALMKFQ